MYSRPMHHPPAPTDDASMTHPRKADHVDTYHGVVVADPYRWMEDPAEPDLQPWLDARTDESSRFLESIACRASFRRRLTELTGLESVAPPVARGGRWFQQRSEGETTRGLFVLDDPRHGDAHRVCDLSPSGDVVRSEVVVSPDGTKVLLGSSVGGSDWLTWTVFDIDAGAFLPDEISGAKLWACWLPDSSGFFYIAFPANGEGATRRTANPQLKQHRLGEQDDVLVYENPSSPSYFYPAVADDRLILTFLYAPGSSVAHAPVVGPWEFRTVISSAEPLWLAGVRDGTFFVATTNDAPYGRVVTVDEHGSRLGTIVPETDVTLPIVARSAIVGDHVLVARDHLGRSTISMYPVGGGDPYDIDLPANARYLLSDIADPVTSSPDGRDVYFAITRPTSPASLVRHDTEAKATEIVFDPAAVTDLTIVSEVLWATSRDGADVPMTIIGASNDADAPVVIEGYGGGGDSMEPFDFVPWKVAWLEAGGRVASAHIRGGGELGAPWQAAALRGGKLLAMEDFIACAERLVEAGVCTDHISITGRSSGGMLAAAAAIARPDLFAACVPEVGMFDPLRYHLFGLGHLMIAEYGTSDDHADFAAMYAYSPLHNIREATSYPPVLITVHTDDDRVMPGSAYKFAATLQEAQSGNGTVLLRLRAGAGHHASASIEGDVEERADILAFLGRTLGLPGC